MHFALAIVLIFIALVAVGQPAGSIDPRVAEREWVIDSVSPGTGADQAGLEVGDRIGGLIQRIPATPSGQDTPALSALMQQIKAKFPDTKAASVLAQPNTPYEMLVQVMDAVREARPPGAKGKTPNIELFPDVSIGDAPTSVAKK